VSAENLFERLSTHGNSETESYYFSIQTDIFTRIKIILFIDSEIMIKPIPLV
jgi:hypothetical protein